MKETYPKSSFLRGKQVRHNVFFINLFYIFIIIHGIIWFGVIIFGRKIVVILLNQLLLDTYKF